MIIQFNKITVDTKTFDLSKDGRHLNVEPKVFDLIVYLIENKEKVVSRDEILVHVWHGVIVSDSSLSTRIKSARQVLGDDAQLQHTIKTVHGRGYQFVAVIHTVKDAAKEVDKPSTEAIRISNNKRLYKIAGFFIIVTLFIVYLNLADRKTSKKTGPSVDLEKMVADQQQSIAILPFSNTKPDAGTNYLSFALASQIIGNLDYLEKITIRPAGTIRKYTHKILDPIEIGKELKVDYILAGNFIKENNIIRLNVELISIKNNEIIWQEPIQVDYSNTFALQDIVSSKIALGLKAQFSEQGLSRKSENIPNNPLAYEYYLRAIAYPNTKEGSHLAIAMIKNSIELEADYVLSQTELGHRLRLIAAYDRIDMNGYKKAEEKLLKALALNNNSLITLRNLVYLYTDMGQAVKALAMGKRMLAINPNNISIYSSITRLYFYTGMNELAIEMGRKAYKLYPQNSGNHNLGVSYLQAGRYQEGVDFINEFDKNRTNAAAQLWLGMMYLRLGKNDRALDTFKNIAAIKSFSELPLYASRINIAIIESDKPKGLKALLEAKQIFLTQARLLSWASYYVYFGEKKIGLEMLRKAVEGGFYNIGEMQRNPGFDSVRGEKEFQEILALATYKHLAFKQVVERKEL